MICISASILVSGAYDRTVVLWDVKGLYRTLVLKVTTVFPPAKKSAHSLNDLTCHFQGHLDWVTGVDVSADKKWVVSSSKVRHSQISQFIDLKTV